MTSSWAVFLQHFRSPVLDKLVFYITNLGAEWFILSVLAIMYWTWNKKIAYRVVTFYLFSVYVNGLLKMGFHTLRPEATDGLAVLHPETGEGYAFPSGHTQASAVFWGQWSVETRKRWVIVTGFIVTILVSVSRVYLNLHWPVDVLGGFGIGLALLFIYALMGAVWRNLEPPFTARLLAALTLPLIIYVTYKGPSASALVGGMLGFPTGVLLEERYVDWSEHASASSNFLKVVVGFGGLWVIRFGLGLLLPASEFASIILYSVGGFYAAFLAPLIFLGFGWQG